MAQTLLGDLGSIPGLGRSPGEGNGNPLQYSCLGNPTDGGTWWATVHRVTELDTTEQLHLHFHLKKKKSCIQRINYMITLVIFPTRNKDLTDSCLGFQLNHSQTT